MEVATENTIFGDTSIRSIVSSGIGGFLTETTRYVVVDEVAFFV